MVLVIKKIFQLLDYFKYLNNPFDALKFKFGFSNSCDIKIKNTNYKITLFQINSINRLMGFLPHVSQENIGSFLRYIEDIDCDKKYVVIEGIKFINIFNSEFMKNNNRYYSLHLEEFFTGDEWNMVDFDGRHVIDVGGNAGDTALYFAKKGAEVISFEPVKHLYDLGVINVGLNENLSNKIALINKGIGGKKGTLSVQSKSVQGYVDEDSYEMEVISIQNLLEDYNFYPDILKMDCEGCEFEIIQKNDLTMFNDIIFEHHSKSVGKKFSILTDILKNQGFKIDCYCVNASGLTFDDIGIIHAYK